MALALDPAIVKALSLPATAKIVSHGGSGFASTFKITSTSNGEEKLYFVKTGTGSGAKAMFTGDSLFDLELIPSSPHKPHTTWSTWYIA
jgi:protein-ribulosamine 3-kinase